MPKCIGDDVAADIRGEAVKVTVNRGRVLPTGVLCRERLNVEGAVRRRMTFERDGLNEPMRSVLVGQKAASLNFSARNRLLRRSLMTPPV